MTQPNYQHPDWADIGPPCDFLPTATPSNWSRLLQVQTAAEALQSLSNHCRELARQRHDAGSHALRIIIVDLEQAAGKHSAALAGGNPPAKPAAETVAVAKLLLANAREQLPKPDNNAGGHEPDPWHTAIAQIQMFHGDALMTAIGNLRDEYLAAGPEATAAWRQTIDSLAHQCRHHDAKLRRQAS